MKGDFTRSTFRPNRHYSSVRMQQGRVQIDADWNEQIDILAHREQTEAIDLIGPCGVPKIGGGFLIGVSGDGADLTISPGRIYVDGILCENENEAPVQFADQPDLPGGEPITAAGTAQGTYLVYLDVWQQHVTALEDELIREVALGGPDTATRTRTVWQVKLMRVGDADANVACDSSFAEWDALIDAGAGRLSARAQPETTSTTPCIVEPGAGYRRLENQLYRVEIHNSSASGQPTFKWSRENGSVVTAWASRDGNDLIVSGSGRDKMLGFATGQWVELIDDTHELLATTGTMVQLTKAEGQVLTINPATATGSIDPADFPANRKVRRWDFLDAPATLKVEVPAANDGWIKLEDGVEIKFETGDSYATGDYWLIPARTATGKVEWPFSDPQPRHGVRHHYCRLAIVNYHGAPLAAGDIVVDCRRDFPSLTAICAEDVCFDNSECQMVDVETVQDALERLCAERDLRHHNKYLHGWGIVCGLGVTCGPDEDEGGRRANVTIHQGYAIDCEGNDVDVAQDQIFPLLDQVARYDAAHPAAPIVDANGNGEACLILARDLEQGSRFEVSKFDATSNSWQAILAGTLLMDFYNDCLKSIQDFLKEQLTPPENERDLPAGPVYQRLAALANLLAQPINPQSGQHIYLSPREHKILLDFYTKLRAILQSETFCAMFDRARAFPDYPLGDLGIRETDMDTIFGRSQHMRIRLRAGASIGRRVVREAYTVGSGFNPLHPSTTINRYDLERNLLVAQFDPIAGSADTKGTTDTGVGSVQDVAFSPDGSLIYVIASTKNEENTFFRVGAINPDGISWRPVVTICGVKLVTLATTPADAANVYAIGMKKVTTNNNTIEFRGTGLYKINPDAVDPNMSPIVPFNAFGHLEISVNGRAFATFHNDPAVQPTVYTSIKCLQLPQATLVRDIALDQTGRDDIAITTAAEGARLELLFAVVGPDGNNQKHILAYRMDTGARFGEPIAMPNTAIRLEPFALRRMLMVTLENNYSVRMISMEDFTLVEGYLLPTQVSPIAIASDTRMGQRRIDPRVQRVYVLNQVSNTITTIDNTLFDSSFRFNLKAMADYRKGVIEAFADLLAGFLQYLKDCLCDHFLVKCPECDGDETLYLACVSIRDRQVYKVCNFSRRRYVKSFPTVGYWLSLVPIIPILDRFVEEFCCYVLPDLFSRYTVPEYDEQRSQTGGANVSGEQFRQLFGLLNGLDLSTLLRQFTRKSSVARSVVASAGSHSTFIPPTMARASVVGTSIIDQPVETTEAELEQRGIVVRRASYDPAGSPNLFSNLTSFFREPAPGEQVTLYEQAGRVRYYSVSAADTAHELREQVAALSQSLKSKDQEIVSLQGQMRDLLSKQAQLEASGPAAKIAALEAELSDLRSFREEVTKFMKRPPKGS